MSKERKAQLERIISKGKTNFILTTMAIYSIFLSIAFVILGVLNIGGIKQLKGITWIILVFLIFYLGIVTFISNTNWKKLNEEYQNLK